MQCPSCDAVSPRGTKRCPCGYVFEFEGPGPGAVLDRAPGRAGSGPLLAAAAIGAAILVALLAGSRIHPRESGPVVGLVVLLAGAFSVAGAALDWGFFMESRKARFFVVVLGREGARWFYALLGGALAGVGLGLL